MHKSALIIFIKNPVLGKVKTRLAATLGDEKALQVYHTLLEHTRKVALETAVDRYVFYSDVIEEEDAWNSDDFTKQLQQGDDLGKRMHMALDAILKKHDKAVIIGSDCPGLTTKILKSAFRMLDRANYVLGPVEDGGYYLLGMKQNSMTLFEDIEWSTKKVLDETLERVWKLEKTYALLPTLFDVDCEEDWNRKDHSLRSL